MCITISLLSLGVYYNSHIAAIKAHYTAVSVLVGSPT